MTDEARERDDPPSIARELDSSSVDARLASAELTDTERDVEQQLPPVAARLFGPRGLVLVASVWAFATWLSLFGFDPPIQSQAGSYAPSMHLMMVSFGVGIGIAWPLLRLSGPCSLAPVAQCALDAISLFTLAQVVLWPLRLVTTWTITRMIAMDVALAMSIAFVAALLSMFTCRSTPRARTGAMAFFVLLALAPALLRGVFYLVGSETNTDIMNSAWSLLLTLSPPALLGTLAAAVPLDPTDAEVTLVKNAGFAAGFAWLCAMVGAIVRRRRAE